MTIRITQSTLKKIVCESVKRALMYESQAIGQDVDKVYMDAVNELENNGISIDDPKLLSEYGLRHVTLSKHNNYVKLTDFVVDKQGRGNGTRFMQDLTKLADEKGWILALTPDTSFGATSVSRLKNFYKRFGFKDNKGKNTDFSTRESMVRKPSDGYV